MKLKSKNEQCGSVLRSGKQAMLSRLRNLRLHSGSVFIPSLALLTTLFVFFGTRAMAVGTGITQYYIPASEGQLFNLYVDNDNDPTLDSRGSHHGGMHAVISVAVSTDNTTIFYDHWENGYGFDPDNPVLTADETFHRDANDVVKLESARITVHPRNSAETFYDGRDRLYVVGGPVAVSRISWAETTGSVYGLAWEVYPVSQWLTSYTVPMGQDLDASPTWYHDFEHTYVLVQAAEDGTVVSFDGVAQPALNQGEVIGLFNNNSGTTITATKPVQAHVAVGQFHDGAWSELRGLAIVPEDL